MEQYISKSAVVAEIERRIADNKKDIERASHKNLEDYFEGYEDALTLFKEQFLDTLEAKEVDLEKEFYDFLDTLTGKDNGHLSEDELFRIAEYFYELGLIQKGE